MCSTHIWMTRHSMRTITALNRLDSDGSIGPKTVSTLIWTLDPGSSPTRIRLQEAWAFRTKAWVRNFLSPTNIYARYRPESNLYEAQFLRDLDSKLEPAHWIVPTIGLGPAQSGPDHAQQQGPLTSGNNGWSMMNSFLGGSYISLSSLRWRQGKKYTGVYWTTQAAITLPSNTLTCHKGGEDVGEWVL